MSNKSYLCTGTVEFFVHKGESYVSAHYTWTLNKTWKDGLPWQSSGEDSTLPVQGCRGVGLIPGDGTNKWLSGKESTCQCRRCKRHRINSWVGNTPWRRKWQPTRAFLPGNFHGQRSLAGYSPWSCKEWNMTVHAHTVQGTKILHAAWCSKKKKKKTGKQKVDNVHS